MTELITEPLYDTRLVRQMSRGNDAFVKQILIVFTEDAPKSVNIIRQGIQDNRHEIIRNQSHSLKSSIDLLEISALKNVIREIEQLAKDGASISHIEPLFLTLEAQIDEVLDAIKRDLLL